MTAPARLDLFAPITKRERDPKTGHLYVYGKITGPDTDRDLQSMDATWLKTAVPDWFTRGNIREQHDPKRAVGKAVELVEKDDGWYIGAKIVDRDAAEKVEEGVLTGFSIGIKGPRLDYTKAEAPNGSVTGGRICETSLVDVPCLGSATISEHWAIPLAKADGAGDLQPVEKPELIRLDGDDAPSPAEAAAAPPNDEEPTMPEPIAPPEGAEPEAPAEPVAGAEPAAQPEPPAEVTPEQAPAAPLVPPEVVLQAAQVILDARALTKADEAGAPPEQDVMTADSAIAIIAQLIISEAESLAKGNLNEACDIATLLDAVRALAWFKSSEEMEPEMAFADTAKADAPQAPPVAPAPAVEAPQTPAATPEFMTKADVTDLVKSAVAEAAEASKERIDALEADLAKAHGELDTIKAQPLPGGPVLTRTAAQQDQARTSDSQRLRNEAAVLMAKADAVSDRTLRDGYRERAQALLAKADA